MTVRSMTGLEKLSYVTSHIISQELTHETALERYEHLPLPTGTSSPAQTRQLPLNPGSSQPSYKAPAVGSCLYHTFLTSA